MTFIAIENWRDGEVPNPKIFKKVTEDDILFQIDFDTRHFLYSVSKAKVKEFKLWIAHTFLFDTEGCGYDYDEFIVTDQTDDDFEEFFHANELSLNRCDGRK